MVRPYHILTCRRRFYEPSEQLRLYRQQGAMLFIYRLTFNFAHHLAPLPCTYFISSQVKYYWSASLLIRRTPIIGRISYKLLSMPRYLRSGGCFYICPSGNLSTATPFAYNYTPEFLVHNSYDFRYAIYLTLGQAEMKEESLHLCSRIFVASSSITTRSLDC